MSENARPLVFSAAATGVSVPLTSAYVAGSQRQQLSLLQAYTATYGRLSALCLQLSSISGATSITCRITRDAAGDQILVGDTTATISTGITTVTAGAITIRMNIDYTSTSNNLWVHMRTNAGTCTVTSVELFWEV